jgi:hypothetical protein
LDVVAQLRLNGILDRSGRMGVHPRVRKESMAEFILAERPGQEPITISQKDVRELQLAKAAIRSGIQALVAAVGLSETDIDQVIIAGAFGMRRIYASPGCPSRRDIPLSKAFYTEGEAFLCIPQALPTFFWQGQAAMIHTFVNR